MPPAGCPKSLTACDPMVGWREAAVTERCTIDDFAHLMGCLAAEAYRDVPRIRLVLHDLKTQRQVSLYKTRRRPRRATYSVSWTIIVTPCTAICSFLSRACRVNR